MSELTGISRSGSTPLSGGMPSVKYIRPYCCCVITVAAEFRAHVCQNCTKPHFISSSHIFWPVWNISSAAVPYLGHESVAECGNCVRRQTARLSVSGAIRPAPGLRNFRSPTWPRSRRGWPATSCALSANGKLYIENWVNRSDLLLSLGLFDSWSRHVRSIRWQGMLCCGFRIVNNFILVSLMSWYSLST